MKDTIRKLGAFVPAESRFGVSVTSDGVAYQRDPVTGQLRKVGRSSPALLPKRPTDMQKKAQRVVQESST